MHFWSLRYRHHCIKLIFVQSICRIVNNKFIQHYPLQRYQGRIRYWGPPPDARTNSLPMKSSIQTYVLGITASYEVGHFMNLYHIRGENGGTCTGSDRVDDTPNQCDLNFGCPTFSHVRCSNNGGKSMNYMDYTDDACMWMFAKGQVDRMLAVFAPKGPRAAIGQP